MDDSKAATDTALWRVSSAAEGILAGPWKTVRMTAHSTERGQRRTRWSI